MNKVYVVYQALSQKDNWVFLMVFNTESKAKEFVRHRPNAKYIEREVY